MFKGKGFYKTDSGSGAVKKRIESEETEKTKKTETTEKKSDSLTTKDPSSEKPSKKLKS